MAIEVGNKVEGKITGIANFGAFVDLGDGKTGLVHISEVSDKYVENINDELEVGQKATVKVLSIADDGKIGLSIRKAQDKPEKASTAQSKPSPKRQPKRSNKNKNKDQDFDALMNSFLKDSEDRLASLKRNTENKRGGRGGRRN